MFLVFAVGVGVENKSTIGWVGELRNGFVGAVFEFELFTGL